MKIFIFLLIATILSGTTIISKSTAGENQDLNRVAVLPLVSVGVSASTCQKIRNGMIQVLQREYDIQIVNKQTVDSIVVKLCGPLSAWWKCLTTDDKLLLIGNQLKVRALVAGNIAAMGKNQVLKIKIADILKNIVYAEVVHMGRIKDGAFLSLFLPLQEYLGLPRHC